MDGLKRIFELRFAALVIATLCAGCSPTQMVSETTRHPESTSTGREQSATGAAASHAPSRLAYPAPATLLPTQTAGRVIVSRMIMDACVERAAARGYDYGDDRRDDEYDAPYSSTPNRNALQRLPQPDEYPSATDRVQQSQEYSLPRRSDEGRSRSSYNLNQDDRRPRLQDVDRTVRRDYERNEPLFENDRTREPTPAVPPSQLRRDNDEYPPPTRNRPRFDDRYEQSPRQPAENSNNPYFNERPSNRPQEYDRGYEPNNSSSDYGYNAPQQQRRIDPQTGSPAGAAAGSYGPRFDNREQAESAVRRESSNNSSVLRGRVNEARIRPNANRSDKANSVPDLSESLTIDQGEKQTFSGPKNAPVENDPLPVKASEPKLNKPTRSVPDEASAPTPLGPNPAIGAVASRAEQLARRAIVLARRGAFYSARAEFIQSLRLVSQGLDANEGGQRHSQKLSAGLKALEEADDFSPQGARLEGDLQLRSILATHRTTVLKDADPETLLPVAALQAYYSYAQQQIADACGHEPAASLALFGLGKLYAAMIDQPGQFGTMSGPKALAFHQAALLVDSSNYRAANEMGVLLAKYGQLPAARAALLQSIAVYPMSETWHNLATVHDRLGEVSLASQARNEQQLILSPATRGRPAATTDGPVQWISPTEFARTSQPTEGWTNPTGAQPATPVAQGAPQPQVQMTPAAWSSWGAAPNQPK